MKVPDGETPVTTEVVVSTAGGMERPKTKGPGQPHIESGKQDVTRHGVSTAIVLERLTRFPSV